MTYSPLRFTGTIAISAMLLLGTAGCNASPKESGTALTPEMAVDAIEAFVGATTSDAVASAFPDKADKAIFAEAVKFIDPAAPVDKASAALADFALIKVTAPKTKITVAVDVAKIAVRGETATLPVSAIVVKADGKKIANSDDLAGHINDLIAVDGTWKVAFPKVVESAATVSPTSAAQK